MTSIHRRIRSANFGTAPKAAAVQFLTPGEVARFEALTPRPVGVPAQIITEAAEAAGVTVAAILGPGRSRAALVRARHMAMALIRARCPEMSLRQIGDMFGGRDHSTVKNGIERGNALLQEGHLG